MKARAFYRTNFDINDFYIVTYNEPVIAADQLPIIDESYIFII